MSYHVYTYNNILGTVLYESFVLSRNEKLVIFQNEESREENTQCVVLYSIYSTDLLISRLSGNYQCLHYG